MMKLQGQQLKEKNGEEYSKVKGTGCKKRSRGREKIRSPYVAVCFVQAFNITVEN